MTTQSKTMDNPHSEISNRLPSLAPENLVAKLTEKLETKLKSRESELSKSKLNEECADLTLIALARSFGAKETDYEGGVFVADFENKQALEHFTDAIEDVDYVDSYEIRIAGEAGEVSPFDSLPADIRATVIVYVAEDYIDYGYYETDEDYEDGPIDLENEDGDLTEVRRKIKVNFRGKKRIKMQCKPGYQWFPEKKSCMKITGGDLARNRKSHRRAILTKRSMGSAFKTRVLRKTKKALRFRKALGVK